MGATICNKYPSHHQSPKFTVIINIRMIECFNIFNTPIFDITVVHDDIDASI